MAEFKFRVPERKYAQDRPVPTDKTFVGEDADRYLRKVSEQEDRETVAPEVLEIFLEEQSGQVDRASGLLGTHTRNEGQTLAQKKGYEGSLGIATPHPPLRIGKKR